MTRKRIKSTTDQRKFTLVYNDFLESDLLNHYEKSVFIALKRYADNNTMKAFPSLKKLHIVTGISLSQIKRSIDHMKTIGVISVEHRTNENNGHQSNLYTLYDYAEIWNVSNREDVVTNIDKISEIKLIEELRSRGYIVTKEKGLETEPSKAQNQAPDLKPFDIINPISDSKKSQDLERFTRNQIRQLFDYDAMIQSCPDQKQDIDTVINVLHDTMNTSKSIIRVGGQDKPAMTVISKLMKLDKESILYAVKKFSEQTGEIKNPIAYITTILYVAQEQYYLDMKNKAGIEKKEAENRSENKNTSIKNKSTAQTRVDEYRNYPQRKYDYDALEKWLLKHPRQKEQRNGSDINSPGGTEQTGKPDSR